MADEPLPNGWLPPRPPDPDDRDAARPAPGPAAPSRVGWPAPPRREPARDWSQWPPAPSQGEPGRSVPEPRQPSSPLAVTGIASGAVGLLLLLFSAGISFPFSIALSLIGFVLGTSARKRIEAGAPGRAGQARAAVIVAAIGLGLAAVAAVVWMVLSANGITPSDLQESLQRKADELRAR